MWEHALVHMLSPFDAYSESLYIYLVLVIVALLGVGRQGGFSSHEFIPAFWCGCHLTIEFFVFQGALQRLVYFLVMASRTGLVWTIF